jgi:hypothetical protein
VLIKRRRFDAALPLAQRCIDVADTGSRHEELFGWWHLGSALLGAERHVEAVSALERAREAAVRHGYSARRLLEVDELIAKARAR